MKNSLSWCLLFSFLFATSISSAQTADEIIGKYETAIGGREKWLAVKTVYMEGSREMMGNEVPVRVTKEQGKLSRTEFDAAGATGFLLVTEKEGWNFFPMRNSEPNKMPDAAVENMQTELDIAGPLVNYAAKGYKVELIGKDTVEGASCYKIKLTIKEGRDKSFYIDEATNLLVKVSSKAGSRMGRGEGKPADPNAENAILYKDYKTVEGLLFPHTFEMKSSGGQSRGGGGTTFDSIEVNKPVDPKMYKPE
jgi:hypothetical protein